MNSDNLVSTKQVDYLDEDKNIRGQNYCLVSFLSPEDILVNKEAYYFSKFINKFGVDMKTLLDGVLSKYPDSEDLINTLKSNHSYIFDTNEMDQQYKFYKSINSSEIEADFHRDNNFVTSMRGFKVRGVFDTVEEAKNRSEFLKRADNKFDIYIAQVGCWCPWSPNPNDLQNQEYSETQLNTLMKQYKDNMNSKDEMFEDRKNGFIQKASNKNKENSLSDELLKEDPWTANKNISSNPLPPTEETKEETKEEVKE